MKTIFFNVISNPFFIALVISSAIIWFLPPAFDKYKVVLIEKIKAPFGGKSWNYYVDLDNDGISERLDFFAINTSEKFHSGLIVHTKERIIDQWNFRGDHCLNTEISTGDYNNDGFREVLFLTYRDDSIFLNLLDPFHPDKVFITEKFVTHHYRGKDNPNFKIYFAGFSDLNKDEYKEAVFTLSTGYPVIPRTTFAYDIKNDQLLSSPKSCAQVTMPVLFDLDEDGIDEIVPLLQMATWNCRKDSAYSDYYNWLMVFNHKMNFFFKPKVVSQFPSIIRTVPWRAKGVTYLVVLYINTGQNNSSSALRLYDIRGNLVNEVLLDDYPIDVSATLYSPDDSYVGKLILLLNDGQYYELDDNLNMTKIGELKGQYFNRHIILSKLDIDNDGDKEFWYWSKKDSQEITITQSDFKYPVSLSLPNEGMVCYSIKLKGDSEPQFYLQFKDLVYLFEYGENPLYALKYIIYLAVFGLVLGLTLFIQKAEDYRTKQRVATEKRLTELQLKTVKSQLDPHFTLNLIASLGDLFDKKDHRQASYVFNKYSTLLRQSLLSSDQFTITLKEELEFVENYLSLEQFRYDRKFKFTINTIPEAGKIAVPKMLVHSFVENSVKHGIKHLEKGGEVEVTVMLNNGKCMITIKDNGVGRNKSGQINNQSTGKGISIVDQIINAYNRLKRVKISYLIEDLTEGERVLGTKVLITIPIKYA